MSKRNNVYKWILSSIVFLFLFIDGMSKFFQPKIVLKASEQIGFNADDIFLIGVIQLACSFLYIIPKTDIIGTILLTGYLGGAVAMHVHAGHPIITHTFFPIYIGALAWLGVYFRNKASIGQLLRF